ncbi:uncharacterized protein STEHIDRAFT_165975 [Stereum hirsutum FP-91666 SS1]|uniref:uncharacterized protein n=1 Tax=Stereum hirsutum (strain FP-91666) TaxID=721885 RepID=UPI000440EB44|nr:uncharacterized protein STEHIDRAFT_165975 [Stereum hirsutum FP-91666 SS1]EIM89591.1 hypothetical protein STEHIDRAFT_165975 [Stereum hirsutum FP-91666 SS1]
MSFVGAQRTLMRSSILRSSRFASPTLRTIHTGPVPFKMPENGSSKTALKVKALTFLGLGLTAPWLVAFFQLTPNVLRNAVTTGPRMQPRGKLGQAVSSVSSRLAKFSPSFAWISSISSSQPSFESWRYAFADTGF